MWAWLFLSTKDFQRKDHFWKQLFKFCFVGIWAVFLLKSWSFTCFLCSPVLENIHIAAFQALILHTLLVKYLGLPQNVNRFERIWSFKELNPLSKSDWQLQAMNTFPQMLGSSLSFEQWFAAILPFNLLLKEDMDINSQNYLPYSFSFHTLQCAWCLPTHKKRQVWPSFSVRISVPYHCGSLRTCPSVKAAEHKFIVPAQRVEYNLKQIIIQSVLYFNTAQVIYFALLKWKASGTRWLSLPICSATSLYLELISQGRILVLREKGKIYKWQNKIALCNWGNCWQKMPMAAACPILCWRFWALCMSDMPKTQTFIRSLQKQTTMRNYFWQGSRALQWPAIPFIKEKTGCGPE